MHTVPHAYPHGCTHFSCVLAPLIFLTIFEHFSHHHAQENCAITDTHATRLVQCLQGAFPNLKHMAIIGCPRPNGQLFYHSRVCLQLQSLSIRHKGMFMEAEDITGLMHLTSLNSLTLSADWIADVAPLSSLCNLTELCVNSLRDKFTGLKAVLQGCSKLQVLQFAGFRESDIDELCESDISELKSQSLKAISMSHCYSDNLPDPTLMPGLITVDVMCVEVSFDDEGALAALHKLATSPFISFNVADLQLSGVDMTCLAEYLPSHAPVSIGLRCLRLLDMELKANDV